MAGRRPLEAFVNRISIGIFAILLFAFSAAAQAPGGTISGTVTTSAGSAVANAEVVLTDVRRQTVTDAAGNFRFENVPPGRHVLQITSARYGTAVREFDSTAASTTVDVSIDLAVHSEEIVVSASPDTRSAAEVYQPVDVITAQELTLRTQPTLGETLAQQPGVSSTGFAPGASRPIIRGFGSDRIRVLEDGVGTGDASNVSPDHNVAIDPATAERIEIVRGPATLLYGSNAVGGVVNVLDNRVPDTLVGAALSGALDLRASSGYGERNGTLSLEGSRGRVAWQATLGHRDTSDLETPIGTLSNSDIESTSGSVGASWVIGQGFLGIAYSGSDQNYGIPEAEPGSAPEDIVRIDMEQRRWDFRGEIGRDFGIINRIKMRVGKSDYRHFEVLNGEPETEFTADFTEARVEAVHSAIGALTGSFGVQYSTRDFAAIGEEAPLPPTSTDTRALFVFEEFKRGEWNFQVGARYEGVDISVDSDVAEDRDFDGFSGSVGTVWLPNDDWSAAISLSRATRLPVAEELYFDGPHEATFQFERGNPDLRRELAHGLDVSFRKRTGRVTGELSVFANRFDGYIYQNPTGEIEDDLRVFEFQQSDADFRGAEFHADVELLHRDPDHLALELSGDFVRAELEDGRALPSIPPWRIGVGIRYQGTALFLLAEVRHTGEQNRVAQFETPTDGYTMFNASAGYRFFTASTVHDLLLRGTNLTDELARSHLNPRKEIVPIPGRDFTLSYRVTF